MPRKHSGGGAKSDLAALGGFLARHTSAGKCRYLIATALGGEPTPPGILSGAEVRKKS